MHIENGILSVGSHQLELNSLDGIHTVRPPYGRAPYALASHHDGWQTMLPETTLALLDELFFKTPADQRIGWTPIYDASGDRCLINVTKLSTRPCQGRVLGSVRGQTEFVTTVWPWVYHVGQQYQHTNFISTILPAAMKGEGWNPFTPAPLTPVFSPAPEHPVRFRRRSADITLKAA